MPNLVGRGAIVRLAICRIAVLVRVKIFLGISRDDFVYFANRAVGAFIAGSDHELRPEGRKDTLAFRGSAVGQAKLYRKTQGRADHRISNPGVAAGRINDGLAGSQRPAGETSLNHAQRRPVLH